jgi:hypothetical protein
MSTPVKGRTARLFYNSTPIGYAKNISTKVTAERIKEYSMDAVTPALLESGNQTFEWTCERMYIDNTYVTALLSGTKFTLVFGPTGTTTGGETWTDCIIFSREVKAGMDGAVLENISGEAAGTLYPHPFFLLPLKTEVHEATVCLRLKEQNKNLLSTSSI